MDLSFLEYEPPKHLSPYIKSFWTLKRNGTEHPPFNFSPISDGIPGLVFQLNDDQSFIDKEKQELPKAFLYGQTVKRREMIWTGDINTIGVHFYPNSLKAIFGFDANILTDTCLEFDLISTKEYQFLHEQLCNNNSTSEQISLLSNYFLSLITKNNSYNPSVAFAIEKIEKSNGQLQYGELVTDLKISERSLERYFKRHVGITPKMFMRICRFQSSLQQLNKKGYEKLSDIAYENGYADQSHFIREFKEFLGFSPLQFYKKQDNLIVEITKMMR